MPQNSNILYLNFIKKTGISSFLQDKPNIFYTIENINNINLISHNINKIKNISEIKNLKDLELFIKKSKNKKYNKNYIKNIIGEGNNNAKILIIGDFPGKDEYKKGQSFSGESENLLNKMLLAIKIKREEVYTTNIIPWFYENKKLPTNDDILECLPFIQRQIEIINPKIILLMGSIAANIILNSNQEISELRGKWHQYRSINFTQSINCLVTYHPKDLIKFPKNKKYAWEDLQKFKKKLENENY